MKVLVDILDPNWQVRVSYPMEDGDGIAFLEEYGRRALEKAIQDGNVHRDEQYFCRMKVRREPEDL